VGGSILNHEHFQGGEHLMPMQYAPARRVLTAEGAKVKVSEVEWYNNVIRLESADRNAICELGGKIITLWDEFTYEPAGVYAKTTAQHNALSPIMRKTENGYVLDIILRNNRTDETYPDGIFHAHPEYHNIKSESIGLIEAMGLFILPGRLKRQMAEVEKVLMGGSMAHFADSDMKIHIDFTKMLVEKYGQALSQERAQEVIRDEIAYTCASILGNTAVFKQDEVGRAGLDALFQAILA